MTFISHTRKCEFPFERKRIKKIEKTTKDIGAPTGTQPNIKINQMHLIE
jgi:hypothetical protein